VDITHGLPAHRILPAALLLRELKPRSESVLASTDGHVTLPSSKPGQFQILEVGAPEEPLVTYSVNASESESELGRLPGESIQEMFPETRVVLATDGKQLTRFQQQSRAGIDMLVPVALVLLAMLLVESLFSNRFYGFRSLKSHSQAPARKGPSGPI
jgi:hypothetical protein